MCIPVHLNFPFQNKMNLLINHMITCPLTCSSSSHYLLDDWSISDSLKSIWAWEQNPVPLRCLQRCFHPELQWGGKNSLSCYMTAEQLSIAHMSCSRWDVGGKPGRWRRVQRCISLLLTFPFEKLTTPPSAPLPPLSDSQLGERSVSYQPPPVRRTSLGGPRQPGADVSNLSSATSDTRPPVNSTVWSEAELISVFM